jgi:ABC-type nitrate/sulfonate/bicarbonate transport system ATPase subunit
MANKIIVLSKKPARIIEIIENREPFPREIDFLNSKKFAETKQKVFEAFQRGLKA